MMPATRALQSVVTHRRAMRYDDGIHLSDTVQPFRPPECPIVAAGYGQR
jgi:hypothetical protein